MSARRVTRARLLWLAVLAAVMTASFGPTVWRALRPPPPAVPVVNTAFKSAPRPMDPAIVWAVGDGADGTSASRRVARMIAADRPDRVLYLGDVYENGTAKEFGSNFAGVYHDLANVTAPTPGNHDWRNHDEGYDPFWRRVTAAPTPPWYAFSIGGWRILSLNSETPADTRQIAWLTGELRRARGTCLLAFTHRPRYNAGRHGDAVELEPIWRLLRGRVPLVISGHDHNLQRFRAIGGTAQIVAGAGGRHRYAVDRSDRRLLFATDVADGALRLALTPGAAHLSLMTTAGGTIDTSRLRCLTGD